MNKREFYLKAINAEVYRKTAWNVSCFGIIRENLEAYKADPYPYRLVQTATGFFFIDPENNNELTLIADSVAGRALFLTSEPVMLDVGDLLNVFTPIYTTYGNILFNALTTIEGFGNKLPFVTGRANIKKVEAMVQARLEQRPEGDEAVNTYTRGVHDATTPIYIDEYLRYCDGAFSLVAYTQLCVPALTKKSMTPPPGLKALRDKLIAENAGRLHDRIVIAKIATELQKLDAEYLKGDRASGFLISDKSRKIVRSRLYLMYGADEGIEDKVDMNLIQNSLAEGWDFTKFPDMNDTLRAGSYNRGKQTESGGEAFKDLLTASANMRISGKDCGSTLGIPYDITEANVNELVNFSVLVDGVVSSVTEENKGEYLGKHLMRRSAMMCKFEKTDFCETCLGTKLSLSPNGLSMTIADMGSTFLAIFLKKAHSSGIQVKKLEVHKQLK